MFHAISSQSDYSAARGGVKLAARPLPLESDSASCRQHNYLRCVLGAARLA